MKTTEKTNMNRRTMRLVRRALALVMSFAIVISMGMAYLPDSFLKANDEGEKVAEPVVSEQEVKVEKEEPAKEEPVEDIVLDVEKKEVAEEAEKLESGEKAELVNEGSAEPEEKAEEIAEEAEAVKEEVEEAEEEKAASIRFYAGGSQVTSVNVERYRGDNPTQYWKDLTAKVTNAEDQKYKISWSSTDKSISKPLTDKVDTTYRNDIKIVGYKLGTVTFTATATVNGEEVSADLTVNVVESSSWTSGEAEMAWSITPDGELKISAVGESGKVVFDGNAPWASNKNNITSIVIDANVTEIGEGAFEGCKNLRNVTIANKESIVKIGAGAFRHCDSLTELDLSGCVNLKVIAGDDDNWAAGAFSYGGRSGGVERSLIKVDLTGCTNLEEIGDGAFYDRRYIDLDISSLTNLVRIGKGSLEDKHEFNRIDFSGFTQLKEIGEFAFRNNTGVVTIEMTKGSEYALETIKADAFATQAGFNSNLTLVDLSGCSNLSTIESGAFQWSGGTGAKTLETVNLSGTALTALEANTFLNQTTLTNVSIPAGMERIDDSAFKGCSGIRNITWEAVDYTRSVANTFKAVSAKDRAAMKVTIGKDVKVLPEDFFTSLSGASIKFEADNDGISMRLAGDTEYRTYLVDGEGRLYLKAEDADHDYTNDEEISAGSSWLELEDRQTLTYNGDEQVLVIPVIPEDGTLSYRFGTDGKNDWKELTEESKAIIAAVDAGVYEIYFRLTSIVDGALKEQTAMTKAEIGKMANPVKISVNGLSMHPNSPAHDFSKDLSISKDYDGDMSDFDISYQVNGLTSGRVRIQESFDTRTARSHGSITSGGVYTPNAAGGVDVVIITVDGKGDKAGNIEQVIFKVPVKVELDVRTITFIDGLGNVIDEFTAKEGKPVPAPVEPEADGLQFAGWNQEIPSNMPSEDMLIEAEWVKVEGPADEAGVIINYVNEEGEPVAEPIRISESDEPAVSPEVEGMTPEFDAVMVDGTMEDTLVQVVYKAGNKKSNDEYVLGAVDENGVLSEIASSDTPLTSGIETAEEATANWALLNLVFAIMTMAVAAYMAIKGRKAWTVSVIAGAIIAVIAAVIFFMTEDLAGSMVLTDKMTVIMANALLAELIALLYSKKIGSEEEEAEDENA